MLKDLHVHATVAASDLDRARRFYEEKLGLTPAREEPGGLIYEQKDSWFLLYPSRGAGTAQHTVMGFTTDDIEREVADLKARGEVFEEYDFPGLKTENSIARTGSVCSAWFKDTEGNILGLVQFSIMALVAGSGRGGGGQVHASPPVAETRSEPPPHDIAG